MEWTWMNFIPSLSVCDILIPFEDMKPTGLIVDIAICLPLDSSSAHLDSVRVYFWFSDTEHEDLYVAVGYYLILKYLMFLCALTWFVNY